jgi:hypothetical protein
MDVLWDENRPDACLSVGLDCRTCVARSAASIASLCPSLSAADAERVFFEIFPSKGCAPMSAAFIAAYEDTETTRRKTPGLAIVVAA